MFGRMPALATLLAVAVILQVRIAAADAIYLSLKANNQDIHGGCVKKGHENTIECISYDQSVQTAREAGSGMATGRRTYKPIVIRKRIDQASPLLFKAMAESQVVEGTFKFYRPEVKAAGGVGAEEHYYTVEFRQGRISSLQQAMPDPLSLTNFRQAAQSLEEEVSFVFHTISWTWTQGGVTQQDTWAAG